jgi:hypothetical protein
VSTCALHSKKVWCVHMKGSRQAASEGCGGGRQPNCASQCIPDQDGFAPATPPPPSASCQSCNRPAALGHGRRQ